ncbi:MAG: ATP phosphoribosyltransferase regulatory subunit, partial [Phycisphaerales bacterium]|nr:ATP phosphoribosyltransferase regulatory subunit [Phycisphaerales bacterium]
MPDPTPESSSNPAPQGPSKAPSKPRGSHIFQAPTGTRDLYPDDVARRRYLTNAWRDVSIRHGFEEIEGPTFEHLDLYTVKSGEGIVSELFSFKRTGGEKDYALRPEFTPTLARMYAARAGSLQRPTKWFTAGPYFRAERPQRGRLREFLQWNVDVMGLPGDVAADSDEAAVLKAEMDADCIASLMGLIQHLGFDPDAVKACINDRQLTEGVLYKSFVKARFESGLEQAFALLDKRAKITPEEFARQAEQIGLIAPAFDDLTRNTINSLNLAKLGSPGGIAYRGDKTPEEEQAMFDAKPTAGLARLFRDPQMMAISQWTDISPEVVRGLAYYTGTVFEVIAEGERAVAGGGRYDNLIELMGG